MVYKEIDTEYLEKLAPLAKKVSEFAEGEIDSDEASERIVYNELLSTMDQLRNDSVFLNILADTTEQEITDFYNTLKSSPNYQNWAWGNWIRDIKHLQYDLKGNFEFNSYDTEEIYNLNGSSLEATRIANRHYNLDFTLHNVGSIKISRGKGKQSRIQVEITDIHGDLMAEWEEYIQTKIVGVIRLSTNRYLYEYRG
ncbi:hypothetical protein [Priestia megaterium]|uniref:hypothetical protein n=1 Tax=Priestia megaterium TaxID=1404 RepID=UPI002FFE22DC